MNYREWLLYRAEHYESSKTEPEVLRYSTWRNYQAVTDWMRRSGAAPLPTESGRQRYAAAPLA